MNNELYLNFKNWWLENNILTSLVIVFLILLFGLILRNIIARFFMGLLFRVLPEQFRSHKSEFDRLVRKPFIFIVSVLVLLTVKLVIKLPEELLDTWPFADKYANFYESILISCAILAVTWLALRVVDFMSIIYLEQKIQVQNRMGNSLIPFMRELVKIVIVIIGIFVALGTVFHLNVASIIAGLGIGGLAVALAGKETLENLFASFTIFIDQPFMVGDLIQVNGLKGTVEKVGFRSTRIRSLDKTYVTIPNKTMVDTALDNITERSSTRVFFHLVLSNNNDAEILKVVCSRIIEHIKTCPLLVGEPTVRFTEIAESNLKIMVLYFLDTRSDGEINQAKEFVNLGIMDILKEESAGLYVIRP